MLFDATQPAAEALHDTERRLDVIIVADVRGARPRPLARPAPRVETAQHQVVVDCGEVCGGALEPLERGGSGVGDEDVGATQQRMERSPPAATTRRRARRSRCSLRCRHRALRRAHRHALGRRRRGALCRGTLCRWLISHVKQEGALAHVGC